MSNCQWIYCRDKLPPHLTFVLIVEKVYGRFAKRVAEYDSLYKGWFVPEVIGPEYENEFETYLPISPLNVICWMYLPELPKGLAL